MVGFQAGGRGFRSTTNRVVETAGKPSPAPIRIGKPGELGKWRPARRPGFRRPRWDIVTDEQNPVSPNGGLAGQRRDFSWKPASASSVGGVCSNAPTTGEPARGGFGGPCPAAVSFPDEGRPSSARSTGPRPERTRTTILKKQRAVEHADQADLGGFIHLASETIERQRTRGPGANLPGLFQGRDASPRRPSCHRRCGGEETAVLAETMDRLEEGGPLPYSSCQRGASEAGNPMWSRMRKTTVSTTASTESGPVVKTTVRRAAPGHRLRSPSRRLRAWIRFHGGLARGRG